MYFKIDSKAKIEYGEGLRFFGSLLWRTMISGIATLLIIATVVVAILYTKLGFSLLSPVYLEVKNGTEAWFLFSIILGLTLTTMMVSTWVAVSWFMREVIGYSGQLFWPIIQMWVTVLSHSLKLGLIVTGALSLVYLPLVIGNYVNAYDLVTAPLVQLTAGLLYLGLAPVIVGIPAKKECQKIIARVKNLLGLQT